MSGSDDDTALYLVVLEGAEPGRRVQLGRGPVTIGRDAAREMVLADPDVSRLHARISIQENRVVVEDKQSTNGTRIDGRRVQGTAVLTEGAHLQLGQHVLILERRSTREVEREEALARDIANASRYVQSLLPAPLGRGAILTDWCFYPCAGLGGDAFGYDQLDDDTFAVYLLDVSGHGVGAAMHSVSVLNVLRQRAVPEADPRDPASMLAGLNAMFQMERHDGMYFTMWYGVYHQHRRILRFACAGHHPALLVPPGRTSLIPLRTAGLMIGAMPGAPYLTAETRVAPGSTLYLFSDGVFEIITRDQQQWRLRDLEPLVLAAPEPGVRESDRLHRAVRAAARPGPLEDDFSLLAVTFL